VPTTPRRFGLLAPMRPELRPLLRPLALRREGPGGALYRGALGGLELVAAVSGIGTAPAARCAERLLDAGAGQLLVVGIAGGIGPRVEVGDLVVPERVVDLASGRSHRPAPLGGAAAWGALATSDALIEDRDAIARLEAQGVVAIDMETSAVAAVCERRGAPWSVLRAISDRADGGGADAAVLGLAGPDGSGDAAAVLRFVLTQPWRVPQLVRLGLGMRRATRTAAGAARRALERAAAAATVGDPARPRSERG
jgi:adenosylhomocysteine nucleosidase